MPLPHMFATLGKRVEDNTSPLTPCASSCDVPAHEASGDVSDV